MLRYFLLAGAAALAVPGVGLAQVQWSQPLPGENSASAVMNQGGPLNSMTDYDIPFNQAPTGVNSTIMTQDENAPPDQNRSGAGFLPGAEDTNSGLGQPADTSRTQPAGGYYYGTEGAAPEPEQPNTPYAPSYSRQGYQGGYYTAEEGDYAPQGAYAGQVGQGAAESQPYAGETAPPANPGDQGGYSTSPPGAASVGGPASAGRPVVVLPTRNLGSRRYARLTTIANVYEIEAGKLALRRSSSAQVRQFARYMIRQHRQGLAIILDASAQAGMPQRPMLDPAHRAMLARLERAPAGDFDAMYMNQQLEAHLRVTSLQEGYRRHGDIPVLRQAAAQLDPIVQHHLDIAWNLTGQPERLAEQRSTELALLDQRLQRGQVYRGYTAIGPATPSQLRREDRRASQYRGYTSDQGYQSYGGAPAATSRNGAAAGALPPQPGTSAQGYSGSSGTSGAYQGYSSGAGEAQAPPRYGTGEGIPGTSGYTPVQPGSAQDQGYAGPGGPEPGYDNPDATTPSTPSTDVPPLAAPTAPPGAAGG